MVARTVAIFAGLWAAASAQYCPAVTDIKSDWSMSQILQYVCKDGSEPDGIDCTQIPGLLVALADMAGGDEAKEFMLAKSAAGFLCDSCLDEIRDGVIYLSDEHPKKKISAAGAVQSTCASPACLDKWKAIAKEFGVLDKFEKMQQDCKSGAKSETIKADVEGLMHTINDSLQNVKVVANQLMFGEQKAEGQPHALGGRRSATSPWRLAAYGCLAVGAGLLVAAVILSRRAAPEEEAAKETELL